ncbi:MAG: virulence factor family protein [Deltaproteobacteria bacterium]|nr:virulence factor family protein [Deltaproteobacteria bacterium]
MKIVPLFLLSFIVLAGSAAAVGEESLNFGPFGRVSVVRQSPHPSQVVLFVSGDGGWNLGVVDMARELSRLGALVAGIDIVHYLNEMEKEHGTCAYPAADFEALSQFVQKTLDFPHYTPPILVGYSSGATLVYAVLLQAPPNTFQGAISMGFCPDLPIQRPLCRGAGLEWIRLPKGKGYSFLPAKNLNAPWVAFQGTIDQVCEAEKTSAYINKVRGGEIVLLPKVGHGFSVPKNWMPQFKETFVRMTKNSRPAEAGVSDSLKDLPLVEVAARPEGSQTFGVMISGDGGWAGIDRDVANDLSSRGVPVVGLNALQYFWKRKTPEEAAKDLERTIRHYLAQWNKKEVILLGYSLGANVLPFMTNRLPEDILKKVRLIGLLGPSERVAFEFHILEWIRSRADANESPVLPELEKLRGMKILCFYGKGESDSLCSKADEDLVKRVVLPGGHHFGGRYDAIAKTIIQEVRDSSPGFSQNE